VSNVVYGAVLYTVLSRSDGESGIVQKMEMKMDRRILGP